VHAVLEDADLSLADVSNAASSAASEQDGPMAAELLRLSKRHARMHGLAAEEAEKVAGLAAAVLRSPVMLKAKAAFARGGRCWREVHVASPLPSEDGLSGAKSLLPVGKGEGMPGSPLPPGEGEGEGINSEAGLSTAHPPILEGVIDLIFEDASGGLVIVDYKTDGAAATSQGEVDAGGQGSLERAARRYRGQLGAYALAVEQATGRRVSEAIIVFASRAAEGKDAEYHLPDLAGAMREAGELAAAAFAHEN
jgi:hypothetical protein